MNQFSSNLMVLSTSGLKCPLPLLKLKKTIKNLDQTTVVEFITTDSMTARDMPEFCETIGCVLLKSEERQGEWIFWLHVLK